MPSYVNHIIHAPENAVIAVGGQDGSIGCVVGPVLPFLALRILAVLGVILPHETVSVAPNGLHDAGPGIANADIPGFAGAGLHFFAVFIPNRRIDTESRWSSAAGLHGVESGLGGAQESAGFCLPPSVHDRRLALAHNFVVPTEDFGLDGLAHGSHVLEVVVVLGR